MGFMDKAKKLAEQAQQKIDEAQKQFNQGRPPGAGQPQQGGVEYDEHGRPIQQAPAGRCAARAPGSRSRRRLGAPDAATPASPSAPAAPAAPAARGARASGSAGARAGRRATARGRRAAARGRRARASAATAPPAPAGDADTNASPDPFKPLQQ